MKKIVLISFVLFISIFSCFATAPNTLVIVPYDAVSGIPVGTNLYHSQAGGVWGFKSKLDSDADSPNFSDKEMIGLIQFMYVDEDGSPQVSNITMNGTITVTITCPNGFYLTSQSNPYYKRPFQILLRPNNGDDGWTTQKSKMVTEDQPTQTFTVNVTDRNHVHFDVAISLPGKTENSTKECTVTSSTGQTTIYPLADLTDYSAVVTFDVKYEGTDEDGNEVVLEKTLTIPFSGYYDSTATSQSPHTRTENYDGVSMNIILNSEAYNIDIKNKRGTWIDIGEFYFNMMLGQTTTEPDTIAVIFFSSSENPYDTSAEKFTMVHDDVTASTPLTTQNSIGFTLKTTNIDNTSETKEFDGTTYLKTNGDGTLSSEDDYIIPKFTEYKMYDFYSHNATDYWGDTYVARGDGVSLRSTLRYSGRIEIKLDNNDITMLQGRYTETIYVHVMVYN